MSCGVHWVALCSVVLCSGTLCNVVLCSVVVRSVTSVAYTGWCGVLSSVALCSVAYTGWCGVAPNYDCSYAVGGFPHMPRADGSQGGQYIFKHKYSTQIYLNTNLAFIWSHLNTTYCTNPIFNINILGMVM